METIPDSHIENDDLLLLHVVNDPTKVGKLPVLDTMAKDVEEELDFRLVIGLLHHVMMILQANKVADSFCLFARK